MASEALIVRELLFP